MNTLKLTQPYHGPSLSFQRRQITYEISIINNNPCKATIRSCSDPQGHEDILPQFTLRLTYSSSSISIQPVNLIYLHQHLFKDALHDWFINGVYEHLCQALPTIHLV